jgi:hypothetical protein
LHVAIYAEGRTDERFLPPVVERAAAAALVHRGRALFDVLPPYPIDGDLRANVDDQPGRILEAARRAAQFHVLIVHADADGPTPDRALAERFQPGAALVESAHHRQDSVCSRLLPIIPVRMVEAWLLADLDALSRVIHVQIDPRGLDYAAIPRLVESVPDPKRELARLVAAARSQRQRPIALAELYEPLGNRIDLERLRRVRAYQRFEDDLTQTLIELGFAE